MGPRKDNIKYKRRPAIEVIFVPSVIREKPSKTINHNENVHQRKGRA
jgi:hypothetical protein